METANRPLTSTASVVRLPWVSEMSTIGGSRLIEVNELIVIAQAVPSACSALTTATPVVNLPILRRISEGVGQ
ncbi:hypothetical protein GCM10027088_46250 [Nocardia goodfellowii]